MSNLSFIDRVKEFIPAGRIFKSGYVDAFKNMVSPGNLKAAAGYGAGAMIFGIEAVAVFYALKKLFEYIKENAQADPNSPIGQFAQKTKEATGIDIFGISDRNKVLDETIKQQNDLSIFSLGKNNALEEKPTAPSPTMK